MVDTGRGGKREGGLWLIPGEVVRERVVCDWYWER